MSQEARETIRIDPALYYGLKKLAKAQGKTLDQLVDESVDYFLKKLQGNSLERA